MKSQVITKVKPYFFEGNLIISLNRQWIDVFKQIPEFIVKMDNKGRLVFVSSSNIRTGD